MNLVEVLIKGKNELTPELAAAKEQSRAFAAAASQDGAKASKAWDDAAKSTDNLAKRTDTLASRIKQAGAEIGPGAVQPMGALIGAGVVLSPILLTLGTGLGGLALAAKGVLSPILKASQATGGLQANLAKLDPEQRAVAESLLGLQRDYAKFQSALKPVVLQDVNAAIKAGGTIMHEVEPVAAATGKALAGLLTSVGNEFRSGTWQQFFGFMKQTAGPDMQLLGKNLTDALNVIPPLAEAMQPLATGLLTVSDDALKAAGGVARFYDAFQKDVPVSNQHTLGFLQRLDAWTVKLTDHLGPLARWINQSGTDAQHMLKGTSGAATATQGLTSASAQATANMQQEAAAQKELTQKFITGLTPLNNYVNSTITAANDLHTLRQKLRASGDAVGYHTQKQRDSFQAAQTYIQDLQQTASNALQSGTNVQGAANKIHNTLPVLQNVKGKTAAYRQELQRLVGLYQQLQGMANIVKSVTIVTRGSTSYSPNNPLLSGKPLAHGGITGAATGGVRSSLTMVGEHGPELVKMPAGSTVFSNPDTQRMMSQGGSGKAHLVIEMRGGGDAFSRFMLQWLRDHSRIEGGGDVQVAFGWSS